MGSGGGHLSFNDGGPKSVEQQETLSWMFHKRFERYIFQTEAEIGADRWMNASGQEVYHQLGDTNLKVLNPTS